MKKFPPDIPKAPSALSAEARRWWRKIRDEYDIKDPGGLLILSTGLEAFDRMRQAQRKLAKEGLIAVDRFGQKKQHPMILVERDARAAMFAALRQLHLDIEPLRDGPGRPGGSSEVT